MNNDTRNTTTQVKFEIAVGTAVVAAVFVVAVTVLLVFAYSQRMYQDPFEMPEFQRARAALTANSGDQQLLDTLRDLDLQLRGEYFRQRGFAEQGAWLLLAGMIVALAAGRWAVTLKRPLPMPAGDTAKNDADARISRFARWAVAAITLVIVVWAVATAVTLKSSLPQTLDDLARKYAPEPTPDIEPPPQPTYPSAEELQANWHRFRGYQGRGVSPFAEPPIEWDAESGEGILWKTAVPLPGNNSPIVWKDHVFLTGATEEKREIYCFDISSGEILWQFEAKGTPESTAQPPKILEGTSFAAPTAVTDGQCVFAMFANGDVVAVDFAGQERWSRSLGIPVNSYGHAASLAMYQDRLIIQFDQGLKKDEKSRLLALDAATGETVWAAPRDVGNSWPSPIVIEHEGVWQVITSAAPWVAANAVEDGKELWRAKLMQGDVGPSPVYHAGLVHVANEFPGYSAIRAGGSGDVTESHLVWETDVGVPDCCSPIITDELVLLAASYGTLSCFDAKTGEDEPLWEEDFDGTFTSSPSLAGGRVYLFGDEGQVWIIEATREECKQIAENGLGEECVTSPAFQDGRLFIRGKEHLFCIGRE
jgi:outer membrane protein assembly factor BamB